MKRKEIEKIEPLKVEKSKEKRKFVAAVALFQIKDEKHVVIDIFRNLKKELRTPLVRVCFTNKDFGNYYPSSQTWDKKKIEKIEIADCWGLSEYDIAMSEQAQKVILKNSETFYYKDSWFGRVQDLEKQQNYEKYLKREEQKERALKERINNMPPVPQEFYDWCENDLMKGCRYIFYKRKGRYAEFYCSCCGETYKYPVKEGESFESQFEHIVAVPKEGQAGRCEKCGTKAFYKSIGRGDYKQDKRSCYMIQKYGEKGVVVRYFDIYKTSRAGDIPIYNDVEIHRGFFTPDMTKIQKDYCVESNYVSGNFWIPNNIPGLANITIRAAKLYTGNLEELKGTMMQYSAIEQFSKEYDHFEVEKYLERYWQVPALEMIVKLGMTKMANSMITNYWDDAGINQEGTTAAEVLMIDKKKIKKLQKEKGEKTYHELLKLEKELGIDLPEETEDELVMLEVNSETLKVMRQCMTFSQIINRTCKYSGIEREDIFDLPSCAIEQMKSVASMYGDYISMKYQMGYDMTNQINVYPRNLREEHDKMIIETNKVKLEDKIKDVNTRYAGVQRRYENLKEIYEYQDEKYVIRPAINAGEIVEEGRYLHHCVGGDSYLKNHATGTSVILFLRPVEEKRIPFVTIEIRGTHIKQWHGMNNTKPNKSNIDKWLKQYVKKVKDGTLKSQQEQNIQLAAG